MTKHHIPRIGICVDPYNGTSANLMIEKIQAAGAEAVIYRKYQKIIEDLSRNGGTVAPINGLDALLLMGNDKYDVAPETYNKRYARSDSRYGKIHPKTDNELSDPLAKARSQFERHMVREALRKKVPLFGICGGMQRINIECGNEDEASTAIGTLIQHLPDKVGDDRHSQTLCGFDDHTPSQEIAIVGGTKLAGMINASDVKQGHNFPVFDPDVKDSTDSARGSKQKVVTRHHQGIEILATGLIKSAYSDDEHQIIKAIEADPRGKYKDHVIVAMQFHPEYLKNHHLGETFANFIVDKARKFSKAKPHESKFAGREDTRHLAAIVSGDNQVPGRR